MLSYEICAYGEFTVEFFMSILSSKTQVFIVGQIKPDRE